MRPSRVKEIGWECLLPDGSLGDAAKAGEARSIKPSRAAMANLPGFITYTYTSDEISEFCLFWGDYSRQKALHGIRKYLDSFG
jgi:hypothetical protein